MEEAQMDLLKAEKIEKVYPGVHALKNVSFRLRPGTVHALMGENGAGKSTLVKCLMGITVPDSGDIFVNGRPVKFSHPKQALAAGLSIIEQELSAISELTVAENILLGREHVKYGLFLNYPAINQEASRMLESLGLKIDVTRKMKRLSLAEVQLVEIAKALSCESEIIIMDEPTSAIGESEVETLFGIIRRLRDDGKGIIYVSHRMGEIFSIADEITVLRDGEHVDTMDVSETTRENIVEKMIGAKLKEEFTRENKPSEESVLSARNITDRGMVHGISLELKKGEILGIFGLMGSGRSEFCQLLFGLAKMDEGELYLNGKVRRIRSPGQAIRHGLAYVTEDRKDSGLFLQGSVRHNMALTVLKRLSRLGFLRLKSERFEASRLIEQLRIKVSDPSQTVANLSGGNQQKVVLGKWLILEPSILILDEPTRGIDVGAKGEIYQFMSEYAARGNSIILVSSELPEILKMSDRIAVFQKGRKMAELRRDETNQNELMHYASGYR